jgi:hypothetical protein
MESKKKQAQPVCTFEQAVAVRNAKIRSLRATGG